MRSEDGIRLRNAARSVSEQAVVALFDGTPSAGLTLEFERDGIRSELTFDAAEAVNRGLRLSIDNLLGTTAVEDPLTGESIPAATARLVGRATRGSREGQVEVLLSVPPFPYALLAAGPIHAPYGLPVGELRGYEAGPLQDALLGPADVGSDSDQGSHHHPGFRVSSPPPCAPPASAFVPRVTVRVGLAGGSTPTRS